MTSTGNGKRPSTSTRFDASAITSIRAEAEATIFSRNSAPPPPLISRSSLSSSSAPSMVRSSCGVSSSVVSRMPSRSACARVASEVGTPTTSRPASTFAPSRSTNSAAVEPVPRPEPHARLDELQRLGRGLAFRIVCAHGGLRGSGSLPSAPGWPRRLLACFTIRVEFDGGAIHRSQARAIEHDGPAIFAYPVAPTFPPPLRGRKASRSTHVPGAPWPA